MMNDSTASTIMGVAEGWTRDEVLAGGVFFAAAALDVPLVLLFDLVLISSSSDRAVVFAMATIAELAEWWSHVKVEALSQATSFKAGRSFSRSRSLFSAWPVLIYGSSALPEASSAGEVDHDRLLGVGAVNGV